MFEGKYIVRALGDSVLWGQGLLDDKKFVYIVSKYLAALNGAEYYPPYVQAHSGATLALPPHNMRERRLFVDTYGELFANDSVVELFLDGNDIAAQLLHKEIPVFYPTVLGQMELLTDTAARHTDLLLLNGGANDVDFRTLLAEDDISYEETDAAIRRVMYESFSHVLRQARRKFDNALIVVPGYYPVFSKDSDRGKIREVAKKLKGLEPSLLPYAWLATPATLLLPWPTNHALLLLGVWGQKEVDEYAADEIEETIRRAEFIFTRANHWQARAVAEMAAIPVHRGPGIIYVHPGFRPENAAFGSSVSYLFEDYAPTTDPAREGRLGLHPRSRYFKNFTALDSYLKLFFHHLGQSENFGTGLGVAAQQLPFIKKQLVELSPGLRAPAALVAAVKDALASLADTQLSGAELVTLIQRLKALHEAVRLEIHNMGLLEIASFLHPNAEGARAYADVIISAVRAFVRPNLKDELRKLSAQMPHGDALGDAAVLRAYGLDPATPPGELAQLMQVHSLAVKVGTESQRGLRSVYLVAGNSMSWRLDTPLPDAGRGGEVEFLAGKTNLFTFDTRGVLHLSDLAGLRLEFDGEYWNPGAFSLFVNGRRLLYNPELSPMRHGERQKLRYPKPHSAQPVDSPVG